LEDLTKSLTIEFCLTIKHDLSSVTWK